MLNMQRISSESYEKTFHYSDRFACNGLRQQPDNGLSNAYLVLKARAMGFDTLIMGMRYADDLRKLFEIPENETILAVIALGYRAQEPNVPVHRPLDEIVKFY